MSSHRLGLGLDFGTSGARAAIINAQGIPVWGQQTPYPRPGKAWPLRWREALYELLGQVPEDFRAEIAAIAFDGTSATVLLCDSQGQPLTDPLLYNDSVGMSGLEQLRSQLPTNSPALSTTSSLAKLLWWRQNLDADLWRQGRYFMHQADWLAYLLHGQPGVSDYHNVLKLGYDIINLQYPESLKQLECWPILPRILTPGETIGSVQSAVAQRFGLSASCVVKAGTTDSIAAFLASGAQHPGEAVTSLGSTLVLKLLSSQPINASQYGIYSHRCGCLWLAGGASNSGGAVLKQYFSDAQLQQLSCQINVHQPTTLKYYPLREPGERFPYNDPGRLPCLSPRPASDVVFLQGMLEAMARIERQGYDQMAKLGAPYPSHIFTAGGGAQNSAWQAIRQRYLECPIKISTHTEAAVGAAHLACASLSSLIHPAP